MSAYFPTNGFLPDLVVGQFFIWEDGNQVERLVARIHERVPESRPGPRDTGSFQFDDVVGRRRNRFLALTFDAVPMNKQKGRYDPMAKAPGLRTIAFLEP